VPGWDGCVVVTAAGVLPVAVVSVLALVEMGTGAEAGEEQPANRKTERMIISTLWVIDIILHLNPKSIIHKIGSVEF
jgi:hypothetical protein